MGAVLFVVASAAILAGCGSDSDKTAAGQRLSKAEYERRMNRLEGEAEAISKDFELVFDDHMEDALASRDDDRIAESCANTIETLEMVAKDSTRVYRLMGKQNPPKDIAKVHKKYVAFETDEEIDEQLIELFDEMCDAFNEEEDELDEAMKNLDELIEDVEKREKSFYKEFKKSGYEIDFRE